MPSFSSRLLAIMLKTFKFNQRLTRDLESDRHHARPSKEPSSRMIKTYDISITLIQDRIVYQWNNRHDHDQMTIFYMHGGAYFYGLNKMHFKLFEKLINSTGCSIIVPDYPLVPHASAEEIHAFLEESYCELCKDKNQNRIMLMGDSSGGGLALGLAQQLVQHHQLRAHRIMLLSPWLDVGMNNEMISDIQRHDPVLNRETLRKIGNMYARHLSIQHPKASPLYGSLDGIQRISIWTGTKDILYPDAVSLQEKVKHTSVTCDLHVYEDMLHTWMFFGLPESRQAISDITNHILA
ncbi:MAG: alpha/beta hydrolase [Acholeplasmataceae bacterium]|nr:MAG: alpha/beta hydrolase [Acholeplasmataceae bacterium]